MWGKISYSISPRWGCSRFDPVRKMRYPLGHAPPKSSPRRALSNNRVLIPHLVIAHGRSPQHLGGKNHLFDKAAPKGQPNVAQANGLGGQATTHNQHPIHRTQPSPERAAQHDSKHSIAVSMRCDIQNRGVRRGRCQGLGSVALSGLSSFLGLPTPPGRCPGPQYFAPFGLFPGSTRREPGDSGCSSGFDREAGGVAAAQPVVR